MMLHYHTNVIFKKYGFKLEIITTKLNIQISNAKIDFCNYQFFSY